jgi:hypothetical protein
MDKQVIANGVAALLFVVIAIVDFSRDTSGIGAVFLVFAAVYVGLAIAGARGNKAADNSADRTSLRE